VLGISPQSNALAVGVEARRPIDSAKEPEPKGI